MRPGWRVVQRTTGRYISNNARYAGAYMRNEQALLNPPFVNKLIVTIKAWFSLATQAQAQAQESCTSENERKHKHKRKNEIFTSKI